MISTKSGRRSTRTVASVLLAVLLTSGITTASAETTGLGQAPSLGSSVAPRTSAFGSDVSTAPLDSKSAAMVKNLAHQVTSRYDGVAAFNAYKYNVSLVPADTERSADVRFSDCQGKGYTPKSLYGRDGHFENVPIPADAVAASGSDAQLTVYSESTDQLWEFWKAKRTSSGWSACWGGRIDDVSKSDGHFDDGMGASASGLVLSQGAVRISESRAGRIDHAIALTIPEIEHWKSWSYPAQRSDGADRSWDAIPMGTRFRLDASVDVDSLGLHPVAEAVARAAQKYGFIVSDTSGAVAVTAASGNYLEARTGTDPWKDVLSGTPSYAVMDGFPWERLQAIRKDWGAPR
ncbi:hypothetical protein [uncultured Pseudokineococcus sp.]|uniref:hypothetical protein n=1 Tax=uncultured Pseudokineococcus sp. TaxID=1642928 RepID=UPI00260F07C5|nr:hypothetical protein [uncultured Pseudokineococcus sp.]